MGEFRNEMFLEKKEEEDGGEEGWRDVTLNRACCPPPLSLALHILH